MNEANSHQLPELNDRDQELFRRVIIEGHSPAQVAKEMLLSERQVYRIVRATQRALAIRQLEQDPPWVRQIHLHRLEHQWNEAMLAWYRSQNDEETFRTTSDIRVQGGKQIAEPKTLEKISRKATGDVRYLDYARKLLSEIRQLGGIADCKQEGERHADVRQLTVDERRAEIDRMLEKLRQRARADAADRTPFGDAGGAVA